MASQMPHKIDMHSHYLPPFYREALARHGHAQPDGMPGIPNWSVEEHLELMDNLGISKSVLSISTPGCHLVAGDDELGRSLARDCNNYAAELKRRLPDRFGYFASLPLPDVEGCLREIALAIDEGCDGFVMLTNAHGHYLGNEAFNPVFNELNRREAVVFIHPSTPRIRCASGQCQHVEQTVAATPFAGRLPNPMLEFFFDTARVVANLFMSGTVQRCPKLKIILPHLGGAFPPLLSRWTGFNELVPGPWLGVPETEVREALGRQFWFDLAGWAFPGQIRGLLEGVGIPHTRLMYGTDYAYTRPDGAKLLLVQMNAGVKEIFTQEQIADVYHGNAERLLADGQN